MSRWVLSVDLGQSIDPSAAAVLEVKTREDAVAQQFTDPPGELAPLVALDWFHANGWQKYPKQAVRVDVRHLERLPLRMSYVDQVAHLGALLRRAPLASPRAEFVLDMTGVGRPIFDIVKRAGLRPAGVTITGGDSESQVAPDEYRVAKLLLVSRMQSMLHEGVLKIAKGLPDARALAEEMQDFRAHISETGYTRFGARVGAHDDLVLAVAVGSWYAAARHTSSVSVLRI